MPSVCLHQVAERKGEDSKTWSSKRVQDGERGKQNTDVNTQADAVAIRGKWDLRHAERLVILPDFLPPTAGR